MAGEVHVRLFRWNPDTDKEPRFETHVLQLSTPISAMNLASRLHAKDPAITCRTSMCFHGTCGSCSMRVNGKNVLGCKTMILPGDEVTLEPASGYTVIRDLVVDFDSRKGSDGGVSA